jgi:hypothetical protein
MSNNKMKPEKNSVTLFLLTLKDSIIKFQGRRRMQIEDRKERNTFNAFHYLSNKLGYKDPTAVYKFLNQSTSRVKLGVDDLAQLCIETLDAAPVEDLLSELKEKISERKLQIKNHYQEQLKFFD